MNPQSDKATKYYEDEINLYDLWKNIIKRKKLIFWIFIFSIISAGVISFVMPKIYRGEVAVRIQIKEFSSPMGSPMGSLLGSPMGSPKELISTKELFEVIGNFDREKIEAIFSQKSDSIKNVSIKQIPGSTDKFRIIVELSQTAPFKEVIKTFVHYLNNIPLIAKAVEQTREQLTKRLEEIDVVMLKSQEDAERFQRMMVKEKLNPIGFNPVQFNKMFSDLEVEKTILKQSIKTLSGMEIITEPTISPKPVKPRPMLYIALSGVISLFFGIFLSMFLYYLEIIKR